MSDAQALCAPYSVPGYRSPVPLIKPQMAPTPSTLISSWSKKKEPRYLRLSEAKASHLHKICTEVSSSVPHFLQAGSLLSPITCRCLIRVLCPVSRPITALVCVLLKDSKRAPWGQRLTLGPASAYYRDLATMPDADSSSSVSSSFLYSA